jgi:hypothetical protein
MSTDLTEADDKWGAPGGVLRVEAAVLLANRFRTAVVVASGGMGYDLSKFADYWRPTLAKILEGELIERGIVQQRIVLEEASNTTFQELVELEKLVRCREWHSLALVTNRWHIPRLQAMLDAKFTTLLRLACAMPMSAEEILLQYDAPRWRNVIDAAYEDDFMRTRIERENRGIAQIKDGTYNFR